MEVPIEVAVVEGLAVVRDAGPGDEAAHTVTDDDHVPDVVVIVVGIDGVDELAEVLAEFRGGGQSRVAGGVEVVPELIAASDLRIALEVLHHLAEHEWA